jgi:SAM-dependent methyltransferase
LSDITALVAFFSGAALDFWRAVATPEATAREAAFCARALRLPSPGRILDVPCGDGRHALALAAGGHEVTGVDLAAENIQAAGDAAAAAGASVRFLRRDMRDLPWEAAFDGAVCLGNSFGYLDHEGNTAFLAALARTLRPGARLVLESATVAECVLPSLRGRSWWTAGDVTMLADNRYDPWRGGSPASSPSCGTDAWSAARSGTRCTRWPSCGACSRRPGSRSSPCTATSTTCRSRSARRAAWWWRSGLYSPV